jgi:Zn-finger nucleic acid-binding protein
MDCPKCKQPLSHMRLQGGISAQHCTVCDGNWLPGLTYIAWQKIDRKLLEEMPELPQSKLTIDNFPTPQDSRGGLCPECRRILSRARVSVQPEFSLERCMQCEGIWCDRGEWDLLIQLGLAHHIERIFSNNWQTTIKAKRQSELERQAIVDKIGLELAEKLFALAAELERHPNGDFAAAYIMRRFDRNREGKPFKN